MVQTVQEYGLDAAAEGQDYLIGTASKYPSEMNETANYTADATQATAPGFGAAIGVVALGAAALLALTRNGREEEPVSYEEDHEK